VSIGEVTISGLTTESGERQVSMPSAHWPPYYGSVYQFARPACREGEPVALSAAGGYYDAFAIETTCIAPLEVTIPEPVVVSRAEALELSWVPPAHEMSSRILVRLELTDEGGPAERLFCNLPDTGHYTLSTELITALMDLGVRGYPYLDLARTLYDYAAVDGGLIGFGSRSTWRAYLSVPGLISCMDRRDCPAPQTCNEEFRCVDGP
jgi:hypothetical protein